MDCSLTRRNLSAYMDKELDDTKSRLVRQHLETCSDCRDHLSELATVDGLVNRLPRVDPAPDFVSMVVRSAMSAGGTTEANSFLSRLKNAAERTSDFVFTLFGGDSPFSSATLHEFDDCPPLSMSFAYFSLLKGAKGY